MLVTSTGEVLVPCPADFIEVLLDQSLRFADLLQVEAEIRGQLNDRIDPELCFPVGVLNVDVWPPFFAGEEVEPKPSHSEDRGTHKTRIALRAGRRPPKPERRRNERCHKLRWRSVKRNCGS